MSTAVRNIILSGNLFLSLIYCLDEIKTDRDGNLHNWKFVFYRFKDSTGMKFAK